MADVVVPEQYQSVSLAGHLHIYRVSERFIGWPPTHGEYRSVSLVASLPIERTGVSLADMVVWGRFID